MIVRQWPAWFCAKLGGGLPRNYVSIDVETTGFDMKRDVITEVGHCLVEDGKVVDRLELCVSWLDHHVVPDQWLRTTLAYQANRMLVDTGKKSKMSYEHMKKHGVPPDKVFAFYTKFLATLRERDFFVVGHNHLRFDERMWAANVIGFEYAGSFTFGDNVFDTEAVEKGNQLIQLGMAKALPRDDETPREYFHRVAYMHPPAGVKVKSNLIRHCVKKYDLVNRYNLDTADSHTAGYDAYVTHLLLETWREELKSAPALPSNLTPAPRPSSLVEDPFGEPVPPLAGVRQQPNVPARRRGQRNR